MKADNLPRNTTFDSDSKRFLRLCWGCRPMEERLKQLPERMKVWLTPQMVAPDTVLFQRLSELAAEYDAAQGDGTLTTGQIDKIFAESDKIQAELWRRYVAKVVDS
jgi:hypothetical protein